MVAVNAPPAPAGPTRRRFAPVPIETTFESFRKLGPAPEPTPDPSPRSPSADSLPSPASAHAHAHASAHSHRGRRLRRSRRPSDARNDDDASRPRRRFHPQLIESSRRTKRAGDVGPATRPTDKTDITPWQNHIYAPKPRYAQGPEPIPVPADVCPPHRRESCDDAVSRQVFDWASADGQYGRRWMEAAMSAYPNAGNRLGGAEHFWARENSSDDIHDGFSRGRVTVRGPGGKRRSRRHSSEVGWAVREMQAHAKRTAEERGERVPDKSSEHLHSHRVASPLLSAALPTRGSLDAQLDNIEHPPDDPVWTTQARSSLGGAVRGASPPPPPAPSSPGPIGEHTMPLVAPEPVSPRKTIGEQHMPLIVSEPPPIKAIGETFMPLMPSSSLFAPRGSVNGVFKSPVVPPTQVPAETGFRNRGGGGGGGPFALPIGFRLPPAALGDHRPASPGAAKRVSPPMLGDDLRFRRCPSPSQTRLESDPLPAAQPAVRKGKGLHGQADESGNNTGRKGLWRGYCYSDRPESDGLISAPRPTLISTPMPPSSPSDPFDRAFRRKLATVREEYATPANTAVTVPSSDVPESPAEDHAGESLHPPSRNSRIDHFSVFSSPSLYPHEQLPSVLPKSGTLRQRRQQSAQKGDAKLNDDEHNVLADDGDVSEAEDRPTPGLHALQDLNERLRREKAARDLEERIAGEFDEAFVTQVYNYLSLGYPATARAYDEELGKISSFSVDVLRAGDRPGDAGARKARGHMGVIREEDKEDSGFVSGSEQSEEECSDEDIGGDSKTKKRKKKRNRVVRAAVSSSSSTDSESDMCPRWRALKLYIFEWARQHPDLENISPLAWGVRERRGSWGL